MRLPCTVLLLLLAGAVLLASCTLNSIAAVGDRAALGELATQPHTAAAAARRLAATDEFAQYADKPIVVMIGDSITDLGFVNASQMSDSQTQKHKLGPDYVGWPLLLNATLQARAHVVNLGRGGSSTRGLMTRLPRVLRSLEPHAGNVALVTICFGANDAVVPRLPNWHVPIANFTANLRTAIESLQQLGMRDILLMTPPPVGFRGRQPDRINNLTAQYATAVMELGSSMRVPAVNIFDALSSVPDWTARVMHSDNLHLSTYGNKVVHDAVWSALRKDFPLISPAGLVQRGRQ